MIVDIEYSLYNLAVKLKGDEKKLSTSKKV